MSGQNTAGAYKLYVEDGILTERVRVAVKTSSDWADYVFAKDYQLKPLSDVASFIAANKHLPDVPSAEEVTKNGIDMAQMDARLLQKIEELTLYVIKQQQEIDAITQEMHQKFAQYDTQITTMQGRINVDTIAHFDTDQSTLRDEDKQRLDDFAKVMRDHHANAVITAEGFADPSGSAGYNQRLALKRAQAVRDYLVQNGGLNADQVRAVGYGKVSNRQVVKGATGEEGQPNRRVSLVTDFAGSASNSTTGTGNT